MRCMSYSISVKVIQLRGSGYGTNLVEGGLNHSGSTAKAWWGMLTDDDLDGDLGMKNTVTGSLTGNGLQRKEYRSRKNDQIFTENSMSPLLNRR